MKLNFLNKLAEKKTINTYFCIFLIIHLLVWSILPLIRHLLPIDAIEGIIWGGLFDLGTNKHPPLAGWLSFFFFNIFGKCDYSIYLLGQLFVIGGFIYTYKFAKLIFRQETLAFASVLILEGCFSYSYMSIFDGFNPNFILFLTFPAITYYFYKAIHENKLKQWLLLGLFMGISFLGKYQTVMLLFPMFLYVICIKQYRKILINPKAYLSALIAFLIFLPHLIWLINNDFFPLKYFDGSQDNFWLNEIIGYILTQLSAISGSLVIFLLLCIKNKKEEFAIINKDKNTLLYLIFLGIGPVLLNILPIIINNVNMHGAWGYAMLFMTGIMLFYFFPINFNDKKLSFFIKSVIATGTIIFLVLSILFVVELNFRSKYPYEQLSEDFKTIYKQETGLPLKYMSGYIEYTMPVTIYDKTGPVTILNTYNYKNPWIDEEDVKRNGVMIITREKTGADGEKNHNFKVRNIFNREKTYSLYYTIIYPQNSLEKSIQ